MAGLLEKEITHDNSLPEKILSIEKFKLKYALKENGIVWHENKEKKTSIWIRVHKH